MAQPRHDMPRPNRSRKLLSHSHAAEVNSRKLPCEPSKSFPSDFSRKSNFLSQTVPPKPGLRRFSFRHICQPVLPLPMHFYGFIISRISKELYSLRTFFNTEKKSFIAIATEIKKYLLCSPPRVSI